MSFIIEKSIKRSDGEDKTSGIQKYLNDYSFTGLLHTAIVTSKQPHADILEVNIKEAQDTRGVKKIITGKDYPNPMGLYLGDKPPLAVDKVRYYGEPIAAVIAKNKQDAINAANKIKVKYKKLKPVSSPLQAIKDDTPIIHKYLDKYTHIPDVIPKPGTNIANHTKIRKGNYDTIFDNAEVIISECFEFPPGDHVAIEPRAAIAEINSNDDVTIHSTTQAPFVVKELLAFNFNIPTGKINVIAPPIGGGFGGKAGLQLEGLAYILSKAVNGKPVKVVNTREEDLISSPGHIGMQAEVKIASNKDGKILGMDLNYYFDAGAYADYAVNVSRAAAISATGPYKVENLKCDSYCIYTNHPFATAYRGFGHIELGYVIERSIDILAKKIDIDPVKLRLKNAIQKGDTTPTQSLMDDNTGDLKACIKKTAEMIDWNQGAYQHVDDNTVITKGIGLLWKSPAMPTNTDAGAILTFNNDGSINLNNAIVEIGQGTKTGLAQIVSEKFKMPIEKVHVTHDVNTQTSPHDWATAASRSLMMAGKATMKACDDAIKQLKNLASTVLRCPVEDLSVGYEKVFLSDEPGIFVEIKDLCLGYVYDNGNAIGGQVIGRGNYIARKLSSMDPETGEGRPGLEWTLGAEAVEIKMNLKDFSYQITKAASTMDVGKVINPDLARGQVTGAMAMGLSFARSEGFNFNSLEQIENEDLREYKILRYGEHPDYYVEFIETPQKDGPYGVRGLGEQGVIGIPGALANAISRAVRKEINKLPLTPESIYQELKAGENND
ncbi:MAG: xanthine dehydrogenase family protein molybdopterin-binding subunit [Halanaerobiales bacterium]|nr:xanthine dehydrogenase family protein molybdopterin-binding subunit [Halanaerobiales bacterium]